LRHLSKYFIYLTSSDREKVKSRFSFLLSSITWIIIESLKFALSIFESRLDVYWAAAVDVPAGKLIYVVYLLLVAAEIVPPVLVIL
jgi:hypothetical protein